MTIEQEVAAGRVKIELDANKKPVILHLVKCKACKKCWKQDGSKTCIYGLPGPWAC